MPTSSSTVRLFSSSFKNRNKVWLARVIEYAILLRTVDIALKETLHNLNSFISLQINSSTPKYMCIYTIICQILGWWDNENNFDTIPWTNPVVTFWRKKNIWWIFTITHTEIKIRWTEVQIGYVLRIYICCI